MKNIYTIYIFLAVALCTAWNSTAQQDPQFTQYMYNQNIINPAYATGNK
ncbi:MAG: type IX secretion system membrane protein PorP/SprF, partial [Nonlabens ulvanivorans]